MELAVPRWDAETWSREGAGPGSRAGPWGQASSRVPTRNWSLSRIGDRPAPSALAGPAREGPGDQMPLPCGPSRGQAHGGTQPVFPASSGYPDAPGPLQGSEGGAGARVRPGERVRAPTKVPRLASSWATRPQSPLLSGQVTSASVGFCAQRLPPGPSESGSHRQVPSPLWESESLRGRTHEATARCPALTSVRFPQPLRSRPEGESGPGPRSPRDPEDRRPHPAAAAERRPSEPAQTCSPDCPRAVGGTAWHGGQGPGWGLAVSRGAGKAKRGSSAGLSNPSISTYLGDDWLGGSCTLPSVH